MKNIIVHGLGQSPIDWKHVVELIGEDNYYVPDLYSLIKNNNLTYPQLYKTFEDYLNQGDEPVNLAGLSLGAVLALNYALNYPDKVNRLILIAPQIKPNKNIMKIQNTIFRYLPKVAFANIGIGKDSTITLLDSLENLDLSEDLDNLEAPTLILIGDRDKINQKEAFRIHKLLDSDYIEVVGGTHELNASSPEVLATLIKTFFKEK